MGAEHRAFSKEVTPKLALQPHTQEQKKIIYNVFLNPQSPVRQLITTQGADILLRSPETPGMDIAFVTQDKKISTKDRAFSTVNLPYMGYLLENCIGICIITENHPKYDAEFGVYLDYSWIYTNRKLAIAEVNKHHLAVAYISWEALNRLSSSASNDLEIEQAKTREVPKTPEQATLKQSLEEKTPKFKPKSKIPLYRLKITGLEIRELLGLGTSRQDKETVQYYRQKLREAIYEGLPNNIEALKTCLQHIHRQEQGIRPVREPALIQDNPDFSIERQNAFITYALETILPDWETRVMYPQMTYSQFRDAYLLLLQLSGCVDRSFTFPPGASERTLVKGTLIHEWDAVIHALVTGYAGNQVTQMLPTMKPKDTFMYETITDNLSIPPNASYHQIVSLLNQALDRYVAYPDGVIEPDEIILQVRADDPEFEQKVRKSPDLYEGAYRLAHQWAQDCDENTPKPYRVYREVSAIVNLIGSPWSIGIFARLDSLDSYYGPITYKNKQTEILEKTMNDLKVKSRTSHDPIPADDTTAIRIRQILMEIENKEQYLLTLTTEAFDYKYFKKGKLRKNDGVFALISPVSLPLNRHPIRSNYRIYNPKSGELSVDPITIPPQVRETNGYWFQRVFMPWYHIYYDKEALQRVEHAA